MNLRALVVALILIASPGWAVAAAASGVSRYQRALAEKDYTKALLELNRALRLRQRPSLEERLEISIAKADFYHRYVADPEQSIKILGQARRELTGLDPNLIKALDEKIEAQKKRVSIYRDENAYIQRFTALTPEKKIAEAGEILQRLERISPDNPFAGPLFHCLGVARFEAEEYRAAHNAFHRALEIAPAIFFSYPTRELKNSALVLWKQRAFHAVATAAASVLLGLIVLGVFVSRPLRWVRWRHLVPLPVLIVVWALAHRGLSALSTVLADTSVSEGGGTVVKAYSGAVLSEPLKDHLFVYGLIAMVAIYFASLAISRIPLSITRYVASVCAAFCITGSLMMCFDLNHGRTDFVPKQDAHYKYLVGSYRYETLEPLPYLLSDPLAYPGMSVDMLDEDVMKTFFKKMEYAEARR